MLAIHGWTPDHRLMTGCLEPVFADRPGYRRLYPDLPGMGASPGDGVGSSDDVLAAVEEFIDTRLSGESFLLVGESYGGYLSRAIAHRRPEQVLGLALICPVGIEAVRERRTLPDRRVVREDPAATAGLDQRDVADYLDMAVVRTPETARRFRDEIVSGLRVADLRTLARVAARGWELTTRPETGVFDRPSVVLTGRQDHVTGYADVYRLLEHYPRATFAILDAAGHNLQIEQPDLFGRLIGDWLDRVEGETAH
ncbi:2-succinyl-6-hydroxy-2, 4-cyclohexadiene-1-carboxylate synthase [Stackebrandtia soli]